MSDIQDIALFRADEIKRKKLDALISDPVFKEACALILSLYRPKMPPTVDGAEETKTNLALTFAHRAGHAQFPRDLRLLTTEARVERTEEEPPFGPLLRESDVPPKKNVRKPQNKRR